MTLISSGMPAYRKVVGLKPATPLRPLEVMGLPVPSFKLDIEITAIRRVLEQNFVLRDIGEVTVGLFTKFRGNA